MKEAKNHVCPRCLGPVPSAEHVGEYPGALSRTDNETEVCSECGRSEAMEQVFGSGLTPQSAWPIKTETSPPQPIDGETRLRSVTS